MAVAVREILGEHVANLVFVLGSLLNWSQRVLKVLLRIDLIVVIVNKLKSEVSDDPHELREIFRQQNVVFL